MMKINCHLVEKNTRAQSRSTEWHNQHKYRLTSLFGKVIKRRKSKYPKSLVNKIVTPTKFTNESCKWGNNNEQNALIKYQEHMEKT